MTARFEELTTFRLGGPCSRLIDCETPEALAEAMRELPSAGDAFVLIGGGSNLLVSDQGIDATVVRYRTETPRIRLGTDRVEVAGSTALDGLTRHLVEAGREGLMCCTGIPGTVAGAIVGNAGAWGGQVSDVLESVMLMDRSGNLTEADPSTLAFSYRHSNLKERNDVVVSAVFRISKGDRGALEDERESILVRRAERHPNLSHEPCIGSIFRNIEPTSAADRRQAAGWFLEQAGAKEMKEGGAKVFARHANIIVKCDDCSSQNVRDLAARMAEAVREKFGINLVREVRYLGRFQGEQLEQDNGFY